jgi:sporulation protein YlmC with PRC-barrel domain
MHMRSLMMFSAVSGALLLAGNAYAQAPTSPPSTTTKPAMAATVTPIATGHMWRSSKLIGVDVYNSAGEKLGDINEVLLDTSGKVSGYVIGVGGFLGMGSRDIMVKPDKLTFANEPMRTASTDKTAPGTSMSGAPAKSARAKDEKWYPDHAVMAANKDQLKAMPEFKYDNPTAIN